MSHFFGNVSRTIPKVRFTALAAVAVVALLLSASEARAGCGDPFKARSGPVLSWMNYQGKGESNQTPTIVGLWHLKYTADDGSAFLESFKTWHADGTEFENVFLPPVGGNICFGVWKEVSHLRVKLHHIGLMFNSDGTIKSTFTVDEVDAVAPDNRTYKGTFDFKIFDMSGNLLVEVKGTTAGTRITVD